MTKVLEKKLSKVKEENENVANSMRSTNRVFYNPKPSIIKLSNDFHVSHKSRYFFKVYNNLADAKVQYQFNIEIFTNLFIKISTIIDNLWFNDYSFESEKDLKHDLKEINIILKAIQDSVELNDSWRKINNIEAENEFFEKIQLSINRLILVGKAMESSIKNGQIDNDIYTKLTFRDKINSFYLLEDSWDTYGAKKINKNAINNAFNFLNMYPQFSPCFVYPSNQGIVGIDFKNEQKRLGTKVLSKDKIYCSIVENKRKVLFEGIVSINDFEKIYKQIIS